MNSVLVLASGGVDSSVLLYMYKALGYSIKVMFFNYGQKNLEQEYSSLIRVMKKLDINVENLYEIKIELPWNSSFITKEKDNNEQESPYVEMRNLIFASYGLSLCESKDIDVLALGYIKCYNDYPDTSESFMRDLQALALRSNGVKVEFPLADIDKIKVADIGLRLGMKLKDTFSCNTPVNGKPCGECGDCKDIKAVIKALEVSDDDNPLLQR